MAASRRETPVFFGAPGKWSRKYQWWHWRFPAGFRAVCHEAPAGWVAWCTAGGAGGIDRRSDTYVIALGAVQQLEQRLRRAHRAIDGAIKGSRNA